LQPEYWSLQSFSDQSGFLRKFKGDDMGTKIQKTLRQWFPDAFAEEHRTGSRSDYEILQQFARYTIRLIHEKKNEKEPFEILNQLYQMGSLHDKNAIENERFDKASAKPNLFELCRAGETTIENEFFSVLIKSESPGTLKWHMELMPDNLKTVY
jgi:hypothetical protein